MNQYYLCYPDRHVSWDPSSPPVEEWSRSAYFGRVFREMEDHLQSDGLAFYLTSDFRELPSYGDDVVAVLQEDQPGHIPHYVDRVLATFSCHGTQQTLQTNPLTDWSYLSVLSTVQFARNLLLRAPSHFRHMWLRWVGQSPSPIYTIPLGYGNLVDLPLTPIDERPVDVFFAGSIEHQTDQHPLKRWLGTPKYHARKQMIENLRAVRDRFSDVRMDLEVREDYQSSIHSSARRYSERMMRSKICPVPRGTSVESLRFFEAIRFGCIPIVRTLPSRRFYDNSPAIQVSDWRDVRALIPRLLQSPKQIREKHEAMLQWWDAHCSEEAVGKFIAKKINLKL